MNRTTLKDVRAALAKSPEERTQAEASLVKQWELRSAEFSVSVAELGRRSRAQLESFHRAGGIGKLQEQFGELLKSIPAQVVIPDLKLPKMNSPAVEDVASRVQERLAREAREKTERRAREVEMVELLHSILCEMQRERQQREELAEKVRRHEDELVCLRSGGAGRPSAMNLILDELTLRGNAGKLEDTQAAQARFLASWLRKRYPRAARTTPKAITNNAEFRRLYRQFHAPDKNVK